MRAILSITSILTAIGLSGCGVVSKQQNQQYEELDPGLVREIRALGNNNWIVIADESFPLHSRRGVRTLLVDKEIPEVLSGVMDVIAGEGQHVTPTYYRARELSFVENDTAPGIDLYREELTKNLRGNPIRDFQYRYLSVVLEDDSKTFAVLVIKTKTALPYSSIFIQLDNGYWDPRSEQELRAKMEEYDNSTSS